VFVFVAVVTVLYVLFVVRSLYYAERNSGKGYGGGMGDLLNIGIATIAYLAVMLIAAASKLVSAG